MQILTYNDLLTRVQFHLEKQEQDALFSLLESFDELYRIRRENHTEQVFWNQFWCQRNLIELRDARQQAFADMEEDEYFWRAKENTSGYRNFEKTVARDQWDLRKHILLLINSDFPDLNLDIFFNLQKYVQRNIECNNLPKLTTNIKLQPPIALGAVPEIDSTQSLKEMKPNQGIIQPMEEEVSAEVAIPKKKYKKRKKSRLKKRKIRLPLNNTKAQSLNETKKKKPKSRLQIMMPNGDFIELGDSNLTFVEFISRVGYQKVKSLKIQYKKSSIFIIPRQDSPRLNGWYKEIKPGLYLNCRMGCATKIQIINEISSRLGLKYQASMIELGE